MAYDPFQHEIGTPKAPRTVVAEALAAMTAPLGRYGYELVSQSEMGLVFRTKYRVWWVWVLTVLLFPLGLIFYFGLADQATITVSVEPKDEGSLVRVVGQGPSQVRQAFQAMKL